MQLRIVRNATHSQLVTKNDSQCDSESFSLLLRRILIANSYHSHPPSLCDIFPTLVQNCNTVVLLMYNTVTMLQHCCCSPFVPALFQGWYNAEQNRNVAFWPHCCDNFVTRLNCEWFSILLQLRSVRNWDRRAPPGLVS